MGTGPVCGVDGRGGNETAESLATRRIGALRNADVLEGGYPTAHNREDARIPFGRAVPLVHYGASAGKINSLSGVARMQEPVMSVVV